MARRYTKKVGLEKVHVSSSFPELTYVERAQEKQLREALDMPGMQAFISGKGSTGKTVMITHVLQERKLPFLQVMCLSNMTFEQIIDDCLAQLNVFNVTGKIIRNDWGIGAGIKRIMGFLSPFEVGMRQSQSEKLERAAAFQKTPQYLAEACGKAGIVLFMDDIHLLKSEYGCRIYDLIRCFSDTSYKYENVKLILSGREALADCLGESQDVNLLHKLVKVELPWMTEAELTGIVTSGERWLNYVLPDGTRKTIVKESQGNPATCQSKCCEFCRKYNILETSVNTKSFISIDP